VKKNNEKIVYIMNFWINEPTSLFNKNEITQIWFNSSMSFESKLNAISRLVILLTLIGFIATGEARFIVIGILTLACIVCIYLVRKQREPLPMEGFETIKDPLTLTTMLKTEYVETKKNNPLSNVLLTDIGDNPDRKPAPPSFNSGVSNDIDAATKQAVQMLNPTIDNTSKQLYGDDIIESINFDNSMRAFYTTANSRVTNDQSAFANYLYGDMPSCKMGDSFACTQDNLRYIQM
jgi:hypothetical protein